MSNDNTYSERARKIVDRVLPPLPSAHGFDDPDGFYAASRRKGERDRLYWRTFARLRAKAEGGLPRIDLPRAWSSALEGGAMHTIHLELKAAAGA